SPLSSRPPEGRGAPARRSRFLRRPYRSRRRRRWSPHRRPHQTAFSATSPSNVPRRDAPIVWPRTWWYGTPVERWWLFVGMSSSAAHSLRWSAMYARSCSSERPWRSFENANPMACCAARVMNKNLYPSSPSSAKEIGLGSLNHLNELDQLKASFASGNRRRTCSAKRSVGSRSEFGNSHQDRKSVV